MFDLSYLLIAVIAVATPYFAIGFVFSSFHTSRAGKERLIPSGRRNCPAPLFSPTAMNPCVDLSVLFVEQRAKGLGVLGTCWHSRFYNLISLWIYPT